MLPLYHRLQRRPRHQNNGHGCPLHVPWRAGPQRVCSHPVPTPRSSHPGLCTLRSLHPEQPLPCLWPSVSGYLLGRPCWPFRAAVVPTACFPGSAVSASLGNRPGLPMVGPLLSALQSPLSAGRHAPCMRAKSLRCVRLCHPMDCSPPGSSVHVQDLVFHYWANRDLRVAFSTHPESQASS